MPKIKDIKVEAIEEINIDIEPPPMIELRRSTTYSATVARQNRINQKKEQFKSLIVNAF